MALGDVDFGLFGVVGGMTAFITFVNSMLAASMSRFYAYSIGKASVSKDPQEGLEECRKWFNTAVLIHTSIPCLFMLIGYPVGEWAVHHFLNIPADRVVSCAWVWRYTCIACFVGMINVPFSAMYGAKQYIAEMTVYEMARTLVNFAFIYFMASHPGDWLSTYAAWTCFLGVIINVLICIRAVVVFPECRFRMSYLWSPVCLKQLGTYCGWQMLSSVGLLLRGQGVSICVNKFFGAGINASMSMANTVDGQTQSLAGALRGAFQPVITQACGAGDYDRMRKFALRVCKFSAALSLIFMLPLFLEADKVIELWLKAPPIFVSELCVMFMFSTLLDNITFGHIVSINADGRVALSQFFEFVGQIVCPFTLCIFWFLGCSLYSIGLAFLAAFVVLAAGRVYCAHRCVGLSIRSWLTCAVVPIVLVSAGSFLIGYFVRGLLQESVWRIFITSLSVEVFFLPLLWFFVLNREERDFIISRIKKRFAYEERVIC